MLLSECLVSFQIRKSIMIKIAKILGIENSDIGITLFEDVLDEILFGIPFEFLLWPNIRIRTQMMIIVEAVNKLFSVNVFLISGTGVPQMGVTVDDKDSFSRFCSKHSGDAVDLGIKVLELRDPLPCRCGDRAAPG